MRRLFTSRAGLGETGALEGIEGFPLEGDPLTAPVDEGPVLRPYAALLPDVAEAAIAADALPAEERALRRAAELEHLGRRLDAILVLRQLVGERPEEDVPRLRLVRLLETVGEVEEALAVLSAGLERRTASVPLLLERGALLGRLSLHAEAERDLREALVLAPDEPAIRLQLGLTLLRRDRIADALPQLQRAAALAPDDPDVAFHLGEAFYHSGQFDQALTAFERAVTLRPGQAKVYALLGRLLDRLGRTEAAMVMHRRARDAAGR